MLVLGIETSCDETAASIVENGKEILSNVVSSSLHLHRKFGGIVPEIASRYHVELIDFCIQKALKEAKCNFKDIDLIAVTHGPGLVGALLIGISAAKALSLGCNIPLIGINHLEAHIYASLMTNKGLRYPFIGLVVSGGHTSLIVAHDVSSTQVLGQTIDDACGEAFDKVARILKLGFPGGPVIERFAKKGNPKAIDFPSSSGNNGNLDFSFSGIKTAVLYYVQKNLANTKLEDICASFQHSTVNTLVEKTLLAARREKMKRIVVGGGVSANSYLREKLTRRAAKLGMQAYFAPKYLCVDNAAMCAGLGYQLYKKGISSDLDLGVEPNLGIGG